MALEGQKLVASESIPHLAGTIITTSNKLVAGLIEGAIGEGKDMGAKDLEQEELAVVVAFYLLNQLIDHFSQLGLLALGY